MFSGDVVRAVYPEFMEERKPIVPRARGEAGWFGMKKAASLVFKIPGSGEPNQNSIPIHGSHGDLPVRFAPNGGAVPGDRIVGILTPGEGITIYPIQSPDLIAFDEEPERWLDVRWDIEESRHELFPARLLITAINEPGTLGTIATVIGDHAANIDNIVIKPLSADFREMTIDVEVNDLKHLNTIISRLRARPVVSKVERVNG
jgi:GTP pyrophosphokinase